MYKYTDLTGDGYTSDDILLPGWSFDLELDNSYFITFNDTDDGISDGVASITLMQGGSYVVTEVLQSGYTQTGITEYPFTGISGVDRGVDEYNFTNFEWFTLTVYKYTDLTGDGYTSDDILLPGWSFDLELDNSYFITFNDTDDGISDGVASIVLKQGGSYVVTEVCMTSYSFNGISGVDRGLNEYNFTNFEWFTLTVYKYTDLTGDDYTSDDTLLPGWSFDLKLDNSHLITFNDTDDGVSDGIASIVLMQGGSYVVTEVLQSGYTQTGTTSYSFTGISGVDRGVNEYNFTNFEWFTLTVYKYTDLTGDGYTSDDTLLPGWSFDLELDNSYFITFNDTDDGVSDGVASIVLKQGGSYKVTEVLQSGYTQTGTTSYSFTGISGVDRGLNEYNFTNFEWLTVSGHKWHDLDGDGIWQDGEPGIIDWNITLWDASTNTLVNSKITDSTGYYEFTIQTGGFYFVNETLEGGWIQTYPFYQPDPGVDSIVNGYDFMAHSGQDMTELNFGNIMEAFEGARTIGFWKTHSEDWENWEPDEGSIFYGIDQAILLTYFPGVINEGKMNPLEMLRAQLLAAELNIYYFDKFLHYEFYEPVDIFGNVTAAEAFLAGIYQIIEDHPDIEPNDLGAYWDSLEKPEQNGYKPIANPIKDYLDFFNNQGDEIFDEDHDNDGLANKIEFLGITFFLDPDMDNDGLLDGEEINQHGTDPLDPDTDDDGLSDYDEVNIYLSNPLTKESDTDGDKLFDVVETVLMVMR
ncbi:MAG: SdrD B-like domain-containing protein [Candidatus Kariarchaeaceae archaeon]